MILIKFEVIQPIEGYFGLGWGFVSHENSLVTHSVLHTWNNRKQSILFSNVFAFKEFIFEEVEELFFVLSFK